MGCQSFTRCPYRPWALISMVLLHTMASLSTAVGAPLDDPKLKEIAFQLVNSAEYSSLNWTESIGLIEDIGDGRGYTAGIVGFCSGTGDMLDLVELYARRKREGNALSRYLPVLRKLAREGSDSHKGLDPFFVRDWQKAATDPVFGQAQKDEIDRVYFNPSVSQGKQDRVRALGQFAYYDAAVMHGFDGFQEIRARALRSAKPPAQGGREIAWLEVFLEERKKEMRKEVAHQDTSRVDTEQLVFLRAGNLDLNPPLRWKVYGDPYEIPASP